MQDVNNWAEFVGTIGEVVRVNQHCKGITFYKVVLHVQRTSGTIDEVPMMTRDTIIKRCNACKGSKVSVKGTVQRNCEWDEKRKMNHVKLEIQVTEMEVVSEAELDKNEVFLSGSLYGETILRQTPQGKTITDFSIISYITPIKSVRLWCIAWGNVAYSIKEMEEGDTVAFSGRFQSREYTKKWGDGEKEQRTVYEISVMRLIE